MKRLFLFLFCVLVGCHHLDAFPSEQEMTAKLRGGMTTDEVVSAFGEPSTGVARLPGVIHIRYLAPIGLMTVPKEGYIGFEVELVDGRVKSWRKFIGNPSYAPMTAPRELRWYGYWWIALLVGGFCYGIFRAFRRGLSEEQLLLKAYKERHIPRLPEEFRFINNDTTLKEVIERVGPPTRERKFPIDPNISSGGYGYTDGPLRLPSIVLIDYDLPYHSVVTLLPEYPFQLENRIRAAFYRRPLRDEEL